MQRIRRITSGARRNMGVRTIEYKHPGVVLMEAEGSQMSVDGLNNVGRHCDLPGDKKPRTWRVVTALKPRGVITGMATRYMLRNTVTGEYTLADLNNMGNLY